jgi:nitrate reductase NapAB chaperone NapD
LLSVQVARAVLAIRQVEVLAVSQQSHQWVVVHQARSRHLFSAKLVALVAVLVTVQAIRLVRWGL